MNQKFIPERERLLKTQLRKLAIDFLQSKNRKTFSKRHGIKPTPRYFSAFNQPLPSGGEFQIAVGDLIPVTLNTPR